MMSPDMLENLLDISRRMAATRTLDPLLKYAMREMLAFVGAERGYLVLLNEDGTLDFRVRCDKSGRELEQPEGQISHTIFNKVINKREPLVIADARDAPDFQDSESIKMLRLRSVICVPLISRGAVLGAVYLENRIKRNVFDENDLKPLGLFAAQAAVSIENAMLNDDLEARVAARTAELAQTNEQLKREIEQRKRAQAALHKLAITDSLTNIFNRRHFFDLAERELERSRRYDHPLSAILMDIDHFKRINDMFGHLSGDQALRSFAQICQDCIREVDIFARYGGEEFIVLLPETNISEARETAERLRQNAAATLVEAVDNAVPITVSLGVAGIGGHGVKTLDSLLHRADQALYAAKRAGRNRVVVWHASMESDL